MQKKRSKTWKRHKSKVTNGIIWIAGKPHMQCGNKMKPIQYLASDGQPVAAPKR